VGETVDDPLISSEDFMVDAVPGYPSTEDLPGYVNRRGVEIVDSCGNLAPEKSRRCLLSILSAVWFHIESP
jgi:hypothetical protein